MQTITPFLWFDGTAEEAVAFYRSIFPDVSVTDRQPPSPVAPGAGRPVVSLTFRLLDQEFIAFNGGPRFTFSPAVSLFVGCDTQEEVDAVWDRLLEGGQAQRCGWLTDRYGLSWQIVPRVLGTLLQDPDREKAGRVMQAMLGMVRLDIAGLRAAHEGLRP